VVCASLEMRPAAAIRHAPRRRKRLRAPWWDYQGPGAYFLTVCTWRRRRILSGIARGKVLLSVEGRIVAECWLAIPSHFPGVVLDSHVIMPDHLHAILVLRDRSVRIGQIVNLFKGATTRRIGERWGLSCPRVWQRGFHDRIIRDDVALRTIRRYIDANPWRWVG
jgi:putative transposase